MRVLVVEDDLRIVKLVSGALSANGYTVDVASDGEQAPFLVQTEPYDAVVLDIGLPKLDGLSILRDMRRQGRNVPVLLLTARSGWRDRVEGLDADFELEASLWEPGESIPQAGRQAVRDHLEMEKQPGTETFQEEIQDRLADPEVQVEGSIHELEMPGAPVQQTLHVLEKPFERELSDGQIQ